ncbi:DedA family protein [Mucilaginibacter sp. KACC 22063]|uniref:DedA family protein n=1 Tax=Mucilaginibacter sp. KACC 22063 TaxID=3025666 RepID=UPI0023662639|nr:VTT domain-containing protein [Mucilaginibacter sp. KACC 22063]WDF55119.1 VTT domain-containing protein [Mucilaginibacter sp. KACC 22063]
MESFWDHLHNITDAKAIISQGGYYLLLVVVFAETGLFFGFFLPGDYLLFLAGLFCATGTLDVPVFHLVASLIGAAVLGNFMGYWFGYRTGDVLLSKNDSLFFKKRYIAMAEKFYDKYGGMALVLGRFFPIIRTFAPIFAGIVKVKFRKFTLYNIVGGIAWVSTLTLLGYYLGKQYPQLKDYLHYIILGLITITTIPLLIAFLKRKKADEEN